MRTILCLLLSLNFLFCYAQGELICPPINGGNVILYNAEAIEKGKYDKKHISTDPYTPFGVPVTFGEVITKGKDLVQIMFIDGKKVAMYFPKTLKDKNPNRGNISFADYSKEPAFSGGYTDPKRNGYPMFSTYPYSEYAKLLSLKDSILYYEGTDDNMRRRHYYQNKPYKIKYLGFNGGV